MGYLFFYHLNGGRFLKKSFIAFIVSIFLAMLSGVGINDVSKRETFIEFLTPIHYSVDEKAGMAVFVTENGESFTAKEFLILKNPSNVVIEVKTVVIGNIWPKKSVNKSLVVKNAE